jgi:SAM-dependent methyltransferase
MPENFFAKATDPQQYDSAEIDWKTEGLQASLSRRFFQEYLRKYLDIKDKSVIDVGSGMGQLFPLLKELGVKKIQGVEPSSNNVKVANELYPDVPVLTCSLSDIPEDTKYDAAIAVMVFEHIGDIDGAFKKINQLLSSKGRFYLIVANKGYFMMPRFDFSIESQEQGEGVVAIKTVRPRTSGVLYDVLRPLDNYVAAAKKNGFALDKHVGLLPTETYIKAVPKVAQFDDIPVGDFLIFSK